MLSSQPDPNIKHRHLSGNLKERIKTQHDDSMDELPMIGDQMTSPPSTFMRIGSSNRVSDRKLSYANRDMLNPLSETQINRIDSHEKRFFNQRLG